MKDAKGHGSNPRGTHAAGIDQVGQQPMARVQFEQLAAQPRNQYGNEWAWFHGSPSGEPGNGPVHVGTALAARQALEARIGIPADGKGWDGSREYGKTLLAGKETLAKLAKAGYNGGYPETGYNAGTQGETVPQHDYYSTQRMERAAFGDGTPVPAGARPAVHAYKITGPMSNSTNAPYEDTKANGMAKRLKNRGVYYSNVGEDSGSVSAVVPSKNHIQRIA